MGRPYIERPNCADCGIKLKKLGSLRCRKCATTLSAKAKKSIPLNERFWSKVNIANDPDNCWEWIGAIDPQTGYGRIGLGGRNDGVGNAHKVSYELIGESL